MPGHNEVVVRFTKSNICRLFCKIVYRYMLYQLFWRWPVLAILSQVYALFGAPFTGPKVDKYQVWMDPHLLNGVGQPCIEGLRQGENKQAGQETKAEGDFENRNHCQRHNGPFRVELSGQSNCLNNWLRADCNKCQSESHQSSLLNSQSVTQSLRKRDNTMIGLDVR